MLDFTKYNKLQINSYITENCFTIIIERNGETIMSKVKASHILVEKHSKAEELLNQLKTANPKQVPNLFAKLARENSTCPYKKRGGNLGEFGRGKMAKEFEKAAFALEKGKISSVVKTKFGSALFFSNQQYTRSSFNIMPLGSGHLIKHCPSSSSQSKFPPYLKLSK